MVLPQPGMNVVGTPSDLQAFREKQDDFNKFTQDMEPIISRLDLFLSNKMVVRKDDGTIDIVSLPGNPRLNERGREYVKSRLRMFLNANTYLAEYDDKDIDRVYLTEIHGFRKELRLSMREYGCSTADKTAVFNMFCSVVYSALKKSRRDKGSIYGGNAPESAQQKSGGVLEAIASFGKPQGGV